MQIPDGKHTANKADLAESTFQNVRLKGAIFDDVNLASATFHNVNLSDTRFDDVNLSHVEITNACIHEMRIFGVLVSDLFAAYSERSPPAPK